MLKNYALNKNIWLNNKYIKTNWNEKLEAKIFRLFQVFYLEKKQTYKLKLLKM